MAALKNFDRAFQRNFEGNFFGIASFSKVILKKHGFSKFFRSATKNISL
jgi:hypothetical protein